MIPDRERLRRLQRTFGDPSLAWIFQRLRRRMESGADIQKRLTLREPTSVQREALSRLMGRRMPGSGPISVKPSDLEQLIRASEIADNLLAAIEIIAGPVEDKASQQSAQEHAWNEVFEGLRNSVVETPATLDWLKELRDSALLQRLAKQDVERARLLCMQAAKVIGQLPAAGSYLSEIAAGSTGDGHALDVGRPLSSLLLRLLSKHSAIEEWRTAEGRRSAWGGVGVVVDELSAPVLVLNLRSNGDSGLHQAINLHADLGEPYRISTRQLLRGGLRFTISSVGTDAFICENPTVLAAAANALGRDSAPLICIEGQPKTAAHILLRYLNQAGIHLKYHGDFDWPGIQIANLILQRYNAAAWRMGATDYAESPGGMLLRGQPVPANWDAELTQQMIRRQTAIHEESLLRVLLDDLLAIANGAWQGRAGVR